VEDGYSRGVGKEAEHCNELMHVSGNNPPSKKKFKHPLISMKATLLFKIKQESMSKLQAAKTLLEYRCQATK